MDNKQIDFMKALQHEMNTQDHVCQSDPRFWVVEATVKEYGYDSGYADGCSIVIDCETTINDMTEAYEWLQCEDNKYTYVMREYEEISVFHKKRKEVANFDDLETVCDFINDNLESLVDGGYPYLCYYKNVDRIFPNTMFLTNRECKEHIQANKHHYPADAHSYAMTAWRSPQVEELYKILQTTDWDCVKQALEAQQEHDNPQPLTLDQLKERVGKPVWCSINKLYGVIGKKGDRLVIGFFYGWEWIEDFTLNPIYDHEPKENER